MADSFKPRVKRATSTSAIYQVRWPEGSNSNRNALGVNYPLFFLGSVIIAGVIFFIRSKQGNFIYGPGKIIIPNPFPDIPYIQNLTQQARQQAAGTYQPDQVDRYYPTTPLDESYVSSPTIPTGATTSGLK
jgi:hypothetical protein